MISFGVSFFDFLRCIIRFLEVSCDPLFCLKEGLKPIQLLRKFCLNPLLCGWFFLRDLEAFGSGFAPLKFVSARWETLVFLYQGACRLGPAPVFGSFGPCSRQGRFFFFSHSFWLAKIAEMAIPLLRTPHNEERGAAQKTLTTTLQARYSDE